MFSADLSITYDGELMVSQVTGESQSGVEFVDSYMPAIPNDLVVVDAGRIVLPSSEIGTLIQYAGKAGLKVDRDV